MLRLKVSGLDDPDKRRTIDRVANLVASVTGVEFDPDHGEVTVLGDPDEHLLLVSLAAENVDARPLREAPQHPIASSLHRPPTGINLADLPRPDPEGMGDGVPESLDPAVKG